MVNTSVLFAEGYGLYPPAGAAGLLTGAAGFAGSLLMAGAAGFAVPGMSTLIGLGGSGFSAFTKGLVFLSCSEVA